MNTDSHNAISATAKHYETHLAPVYLWMAGGFDASISRGGNELDTVCQNPPNGSTAVDLGAGFGMHAIPLARRGYSVLAIDTSSLLLDVLRDHVETLPVLAVEDDLLAFQKHLKAKAQLILCMGDTLTHLSETQSVEQLFSRVAESLDSGGTFITTFRDYTSPLVGEGRFIPVRADSDRIMTCFLEYFPDYVTVHDILHERNGSSWQSRISAYRKLRLSQEWVSAALQARGFAVRIEPGLAGMVRVIAHARLRSPFMSFGKQESTQNMNPSSPQRFNALASGYAISEVHTGSPTLDRLHTLLPHVDSVCDLASGAGHTGLGFAGIASRIVAVDPAPNMLAQVRCLAAERGVAVETVDAFAESIPLASASFDLVVCRLAAHHFSDLHKAMAEMVRLVRPGGHVAVIDMEGDDDPSLDALNHEIEVLHDPTHVRSYTAKYWRELFAANGLAIEACENRCREIPDGLTVERWCELGDSGTEALQSIHDRLASVPPEWLSELEIMRDADGKFRIPVRTLLILGSKPSETLARRSATSGR